MNIFLGPIPSRPTLPHTVHVRSISWHKSELGVFYQFIHCQWFYTWKVTVMNDNSDAVTYKRTKEGV